MDPLFHFVFAILAALAIGLHKKHRFEVIVLLAFIAVLIDVDHFIFAYPRAFHNIFIVVLLPIALFLCAYEKEKGTGSIKYQSYFLIALIMLVSHVTADMFWGDKVALFYPFSSAAFTFSVPFTLEFAGYTLISSTGIAMAVLVSIVCLAYFVEDFIYYFEAKHESLKRALRDTEKDIF